HRCGAENYSKGFTSWEQFVAMLFCQLAQAQSLREICGGLKCCVGKLTHLGVGKAPPRSTLSYANAHRPWELYRDIFRQLLQRCQAEAALQKRKFRFRNKLYSLDATVIRLCVTMFDWAKYRQTKGGVKLHLLLDHDGYLPTFAHITEGRRHEVKVAQNMAFAPDSVIVFDKGYTDYGWFRSLNAAGVWFVTRMKKNAVYEVVERRPLPQRRNILADEMIRLKGSSAAGEYPALLRRVVVWDAENEKELVLLTNHAGFGSTTISSIYKERWQIELFFKAIKQNLKIKTFVGTSANALHTQIWTALIAMLLLKYLKMRSKAQWSLSNLVAFLRWNLFTYRDLWVWIDDPFDTPPQPPPFDQLLLDLPGVGQQKAATSSANPAGTRPKS
ncbi:MAG: IS4 family transposase, partial [bacterium]|nr:IS4 family transposase [bacterium]